LDWLCRFNQIDWSRAVVDSCSVRAVFGGELLFRGRKAAEPDPVKNLEKTAPVTGLVQ